MKADLKTIEYAPGKVLTVDTGRLAKQANGSAFVRIGDTVVMATATAAREAKPGQPFFPLTVEFKETFAAGGKFPGGFIKREGRPSEKEILSARLIDRTIRPLFPDGFMNETQVICQVFSSDGENDGDVIGAVASSLSLTLSDIPFEGPMAQVRVARINGETVINPTVTELKAADIEMTVGGTLESVVMVEGEMSEISEEDMVDAIRKAHDAIKKLCQFQLELRKEFGKEKWDVSRPEISKELIAKVTKLVGDRYSKISKKGLAKKVYSTESKEIVTEIQESLAESFPDQEEDIADICHDIQKTAMRKLIIEEKLRIDGRKPEDIRPIWTEVGYLPRTHGSAIFTRGETQALVSVTLGTKRDEQMIDTLFYNDSKRFMLDYNFPPYCTGEVKMMRGVSRREIGHGNLAERALRKVIPTTDEFDYTIRVVSDVLESNGSSSMASVCGGSMALMDAGVPIKKPVAGIAMGMIVGDGKSVVLSDIQGEEDHMGDMDFKVTGTLEGITACQMDIKVKGISYEVMIQALQQARDGRMYILERMAESISAPRSEVSQYAPSFVKVEVETDQIGGIIGPGGKVIQSIQRESGAEVMIEEVGNKGIVTISADSKEKINEAVKRIKAITGSLEEGEVYLGTVRSIKEYGAFVEIMPGRDGLLHISEIDHKRINKVSDVLSEGQQIEVKLVRVEDGGKLRLSRKALIPNENEG
ncbi:MAG: polyribonucleotide nucleotidyltransferase [Balneolales bacterium]